MAPQLTRTSVSMKLLQFLTPWLLPFSLLADQPALNTARQIIDIVDVRSDMVAALDQVKEAQRRFIFSQDNIPDDAKPEVADKVSDIFNDSIEAIFDESFFNSLAQVYTDVYTDEELEQLLAFYNSPIGRKLLEVEPVIGREMNTLMSPRIQAAQQILVVRIQSVLEQYVTTPAETSHSHSGHDHSDHTGHDHSDNSGHDH